MQRCCISYTKWKPCEQHTRTRPSEDNHNHTTFVYSFGQFYHTIIGYIVKRFHGSEIVQTSLPRDDGIKCYDSCCAYSISAALVTILHSK